MNIAGSFRQSVMCGRSEMCVQACVQVAGCLLVAVEQI